MSPHLCFVNVHVRVFFYSLQNLWKEQKFRVTLCHSILQGGQNCKIKIELI